MANELQISYGISGKTLYAVVRNSISQPWRTDTNVFEAYNSANWSKYAISLTEQGVNGYYAGTFPAAIAQGTFAVTAYQQIGGTPAENDPRAGAGNYEWNGTAVAPLSDTATSGLIGQSLPLRLARGNMILNFPLYMRSASDHVSAFTSGVISGQISRDGGAFGALQSGLFSEVGLGIYKTTLTSGDLLCNTAGLVFTGVGISGGNADPLAMSFILQRTSGQ